jgi:hypothetical protein
MKTSGDSVVRKLIRFPFTLYALVGVIMWAVVAIGNIHYDESGLRGGLFALTEIFRFPFWAIEEVLFALNGGKAIPGQHVVATILGLFGCVTVDYFLIQRLVKSWR